MTSKRGRLQSSKLTPSCFSFCFFLLLKKNMYIECEFLTSSSSSLTRYLKYKAKGLFFLRYNQASTWVDLVQNPKNGKSPTMVNKICAYVKL